jgi:hypothetical protein
MSVNHLPQSTRLQICGDLRKLKERRSEATAGLRQVTNSASSVGAALTQDLELWGVKEEKVTARIEKSR